MKSFLRAWCQRWSNKAEYINNLGQELARRSNIWHLQSAFSYGQKMTEILPIKSKMTRWVVAGLLTSYCERFEPRSHFKGRLSLIVRVNVVLNSTVVVDSDSQSRTTVLFRTTLTWTIKLNLLLLLIGWKAICTMTSNSLQVPESFRFSFKCGDVIGWLLLQRCEDA